MEKIVHVYNTFGQAVCSKEFEENEYNTVPYGYEEIGEMKKEINSICKKCAWLIGKPYFSNDELFDMGITDDDLFIRENFPDED